MHHAGLRQWCRHAKTQSSFRDIQDHSPATRLQIDKREAFHDHSLHLAAFFPDSLSIHWRVQRQPAPVSFSIAGDHRIRALGKSGSAYEHRAAAEQAVPGNVRARAGVRANEELRPT